MLSVYFILAATNIIIGLFSGFWLSFPYRTNSNNFKIVYLSILLISMLEVFYWLCQQSGTLNEPGLLLAIFTQMIWSCVLLYSSFQLNAALKQNAILQNELQKHQHLYNEIKSMALSDALTNIANRRNFDMFLTTELHRAATLRNSVSLIIFDLDKFKIYNDTFGHLTGDKLLAQIGQILLHHVRTGDLPARYGGEEFSIILPDTGLTAALESAEKLRTIIETSNFPDHFGSFTAKITASFGVATYDPTLLGKQPDAEKIISIADKALYKAKQQGRNCVVASTIFQ